MTQIDFPPVEEQLSCLLRGVAEVVPEQPIPPAPLHLMSVEPLSAKLVRSRSERVPLRVKLGVDPTAPDIHLGHTVVIRKLKHFQDMGHTAIFLIGDFTALVGDPTGQSETRPPLSREQINANAQTYLEQVFKILDREKTEIRYNSEWLDGLSSYDIVRLCGKYRVARMLEREDFRFRLKNNQPISMHELLYPLFQAYDSVALQADVELGATEQKFNLLMGRDIQREYYFERGLTKGPQVALMMPILAGLDGHRKMSKSLGNYVGITEAAGEIFGKLMSIPDELMWSYYELLTDRTGPVIRELRSIVESGTEHPMDRKMLLASEITAGFHGQPAADLAFREFQRVFRHGQVPTELRKISVSAGERSLLTLLKETGLVPSRSEAERLIKQGAVELDGGAIKDVKHIVRLPKGASWILRVGKKNFVELVGI